MFYKDELFSNSNIFVDMVNLCSFFRGCFFLGEGVLIYVLLKKMFFFLVGFLIKLLIILIFVIYFSIFR